MRRIASFVARIVSGACAAIRAAYASTALIDGLARLQPRHQSPGVRLDPVHEPAAEQEILHQSRPHQIDQPAAARARQTVAQRAGDRNAEGRVRRGDAKIAGERDRTAAARRDALDLRDGRLGDPLEPIEDRVDPLLVGDPVAGVAKTLELLDIGAGDKRLAAGAPEDHTRTPASLSTRSQASTSA